MERVETAPQCSGIAGLSHSSNPLLSLSTTAADEASSSSEPTEAELPKAAAHHRCCCNLIHIKIASYLISSVFAILIISNFLVKIAGLTDLEWNWEFLFLCSDSIAVACLFYGTFAESAAFFQPFVVLSVSLIFEMLIAIFDGIAV